MSTELCTIMKEAGSDKGLDWHNYTVFYNDLFEKQKETFKNVFELGLGTNDKKFPSSMKPGYTPGASQRGWKSYFTVANVYGADIDDKILFSEDRIKCFHVDQTDAESVKQLWDNPELKNVKFDFILDDGLHTLQGAKVFFENSFNQLSNDGIYIIEDVQKKAKQEYCDYFDSVSDQFNINYVFIELEYNQNRTDNNLVVICNKENNIYDDILAKYS